MGDKIIRSHNQQGGITAGSITVGGVKGQTIDHTGALRGGFRVIIGSKP